MQILKRVRDLFLLLFFLIFPILHAISQSTFKIGFLIRDKSDLAVQRAAQIAIDHANDIGGHNGKKFELITRSCDGPWGMTSKQAVALIYEDQVPIVVTALDGRNAHLAEQVTAKSHVVMLSTLSSDPTLSRAYVPWYFRMVPDDKQQAAALVEQIYRQHGAENVAVISSDDYDGKTSADTFIKLALEEGFPGPEALLNADEGVLGERISKNSWDAVVLAGSSEKAPVLFESIDNQRIYGFLNVFNFLEVQLPYDEIQLGIPFGDDLENLKRHEFASRYQKVFGEKPNISAYFVCDGIFLAVEAIKKYGTDSEAIRTGFKDLKYQGITGIIEFGKLGNREF